MARTLRVVVADDHPFWRAGIAAVLEEEGMEVVARVPDADALVDAVAGTSPDAIVVDVQMPPGMDDDGLRAAKLIRVRHPGVAVVILTGYRALPAGFDVRGGASGAAYMFKEEAAATPELLGDYVRRAARGERLISEKTAHDMAHDISVRRQLEGLTQAEHEVLTLLAEGLTQREIARRRGVAARTVETQAASIYAKLGLRGMDGDMKTLAIQAFMRHAPPKRPAGRGRPRRVPSAGLSA